MERALREDALSRHGAHALTAPAAWPPASRPACRPTYAADDMAGHPTTLALYPPTAAAGLGPDVPGNRIGHGRLRIGPDRGVRAMVEGRECRSESPIPGRSGPGRRVRPDWQCGGKGFESPQLHPS